MIGAALAAHQLTLFLREAVTAGEMTVNLLTSEMMSREESLA